MEMCVISLRFCWFPFFVYIYVGMLFAYQTTAIVTTKTTTTTISSRLSYSYVRSWSMCVSITTLLQLPAAVYFFHYTYIFIIILHHHGVDLGLIFHAIGFFLLLYIVFIHLHVCILFEGNCSQKSSRLPGLWTIWLREEIIHSIYFFIILSRAQAMAENMIIDYRVFVI